MKNRVRLFALACVLGLSTVATPLTTLAAAPAVQDVVRIKTNLGSFDVRLDANRAPVTVRNFLSYVNKGFYNGTIFHRVMDVIDKISIVKTQTKGFYENVPVTPVVIESVTVLNSNKVK